MSASWVLLIIFIAVVVIAITAAIIAGTVRVNKSLGLPAESGILDSPLVSDTPAVPINDDYAPAYESAN